MITTEQTNHEVQTVEPVEQIKSYAFEDLIKGGICPDCQSELCIKGDFKICSNCDFLTC